MTNHQSPITVLFICTGNICRSPMAKALLQRRYADHGVIAGSAGLRGLDGQPAHPLAQAVAAQLGADLSQHRASTVTPELLARADMILTMETSHRDWIVDRMPALQDKTHLLGRWRDEEIPDPMGGIEADFRVTLEHIERCLDDWLPLLPLPETTTGSDTLRTLVTG